MKLSLLALVASLTVALASKKTYIVTYPFDTPESEVDKAAAAVERDGGVINHRYTLLKGFSVVASPEMMITFKSFAIKEEYPASVEEDQMVYAMGDDDKAA